MPRSSSSSPDAPVPRIPRRRKWTREQLLRNLEILGTLSAPLPPTLPPSPPASRAPSPSPGFKRKSDATSDQDHVKRPRTASVSDRSHLNPQHHQPPVSLPPPHLRVSNPTPAFSARSEPCEDGEVREEPVASSSRGPPEVTVVVPSSVPIRRPKRGKPTLRHFDSLHDHYHNAGRMLKYSGDARFWSTYPASHREYRPLADPPPPNSSYHKHGGLVARLELVDALVCFTYSIWNKDYSRRSCNKETWRTIEAFLVWCKQKWQAEEGIHDAEKAFLGLIWMIEAFIHGRKMTYTVRGHLDADMDKIVNNCKAQIVTALAQGEEDSILGVNAGLLASKSQPTPPMLPSPASIAPANSANSTPTNRDSGTPNTGDGRSVSSMSASAVRPPAFVGPFPIPIPLLPKETNVALLPPSVIDAMTSIRIPIGPPMIQDLKDQTAGISAAAWCMSTSQNSLNLPIMARFFPTTFARMIHSSLSPNEEHEPDFEDEDGELFWPGQSITGEGLGWVCLMGKAMIKEFGKAYGYKGLDGVVPKPKPEEEDGAVALSTQNGTAPQRPGSTPLGHPHGLSVER